MINLQQKVIDHSQSLDYFTSDFASDIDDNFQEMLGGVLIKGQSDSLSIPIPKDSLIEKILLVKVTGNPLISLNYVDGVNPDIPIFPTDSLVENYLLAPSVGIYSMDNSVLSLGVANGSVHIKIFLSKNLTQ